MDGTSRARAVPVDSQDEPVRAGLDPVLGLHVGHGLGTVPIDGQDVVPRAQVALCSFTTRCYLSHTNKEDKRDRLGRGETPR